MEKAKSENGVEVMNEEKMLKEAEASFSPFSYPPFSRKRCKIIVLVTCIITVIVGLSIVSAIVSQLPVSKSFMELANLDELTAEQEQQALSLGVSVLLYFGLGALIVACITVGAAFLARKISLDKQKSKYESEKNAAYAKWEEAKQAFMQTKKRDIEKELALKEILTCAFCGGEIIQKIDLGEKVKRSFVEKVYNVQVTGTTSATLTPDYKTSEWYEYKGGSIECSCPKCNYNIKKSEFSGYNGYSRSFPMYVSTGSKVTEAEVEKTKLYKYVKDYTIQTMAY